MNKNVRVAASTLKAHAGTRMGLKGLRAEKNIPAGFEWKIYRCPFVRKGHAGEYTVGAPLTVSGFGSATDLSKPIRTVRDFLVHRYMWLSGLNRLSRVCFGHTDRIKYITVPTEDTYLIFVCAGAVQEQLHEIRNQQEGCTQAVIWNKKSNFHDTSDETLDLDDVLEINDSAYILPPLVPADVDAAVLRSIQLSGEPKEATRLQISAAQVKNGNEIAMARECLLHPSYWRFFPQRIEEYEALSLARANVELFLDPGYKLGMRALKPIAQGQELFLHYGREFWIQQAGSSLFTIPFLSNSTRNFLCSESSDEEKQEKKKELSDIRWIESVMTDPRDILQPYPDLGLAIPGFGSARRRRERQIRKRQILHHKVPINFSDPRCIIADRGTMSKATSYAIMMECVRLSIVDARGFAFPLLSKSTDDADSFCIKMPHEPLSIRDLETHLRGYYQKSSQKFVSFC